MSNKIRFGRMTVLAFAATVAVSAQATFVDGAYASGTQLVTNAVASVALTSGSLDDGYWTRTLAPGYDHYCTGTALTTVHVSTNGLMSLGTATTDFSNSALNASDSSLRYVAPLWDDLDLRPANSPTANVWIRDTASFTSFTVQNARRFSALAGDTGFSFQAILVKSNTYLGFNNVGAGDILFSYEAIGTVATNATVGTKNTNAFWTQAPGGDGFGLFSQEAANTLPTNNRYIWFRWNSTSGNYSSAVVPEPASMIALGLGAAAMIRRRSKKA